MILTIETQHPEAEGLSYLLHKHPARLQSFTQSFGSAWVFYPVAVAGHTKVAVLLDVDPGALVRRKGRPAGDGFSLGQYVNDRGYAACSFLSVALADMFGSALNGKCKDKPELVDVAFPFVVSLPAVPCRAGGEFLHQLFEPLGYSLEVTPLPLDEKFPDWEMSQCFKLTLRATLRLRDLLTHLYVLIPVLDNDKHYWVGRDEVEKLLHRGEGWLPGHPLKEKIVHRYLKYQKQLTTPALEILAEDEVQNPDEVLEEQNTEEERIERDLSLHEQRLGTVLATLKSSGASRVLDLGCGEGKLLRLLLKENQFTKIVGMDVSHRALERAAEKLKIERMPDFQKARINLLHGSLIYRDQRLAGFDAAVLVEVIEHLDTPRLKAMERSVFEFAKPAVVVVTTPNVEFNVKFETLPAGRMRHRDHRFEWTRSEFQTWAQHVATTRNYSVRFLPIGADDPTVGPPTQMAIFTINPA